MDSKADVKKKKKKQPRTKQYYARTYETHLHIYAQKQK